MINAQFDVTGMSCAHCKAAVEGELDKLPGVEYSIAVPDAGVVEVEFDENRVGPERLIKTIEDAGYGVAS
jgi:copper chaperone